MPFFTYGQKEIAHLKAKDPVLGAYIEQRGMIYRSVNPDLFSALVSSIISQQITGKAAQTVFQRLKDLAGEIKPENIVKHTIEELQKCGMSFRKASYIRDLSEKVATKTFDLESIRALNDE
ncbi:MAG: DNA-3-methyladenine glycosylase 2 family protein, partial [Bacilli bacterium]